MLHYAVVRNFYSKTVRTRRRSVVGDVGEVCMSGGSEFHQKEKKEIETRVDED